MSKEYLFSLLFHFKNIQYHKLKDGKLHISYSVHLNKKSPLSWLFLIVFFVYHIFKNGINGIKKSYKLLQNDFKVFNHYKVLNYHPAYDELIWFK